MLPLQLCGLTTLNSEKNHHGRLDSFFWTLFETATYVEIERDRKVTLEAQLGLIGGTMGLFTGFSILSSVEIIYYAVKVLMTPNQVGHTMVHSSSTK